MSSGLEEQKNFVIDAILDLKQKANTLTFLVTKLDERDDPVVGLTLDVFDNLLNFVYRMLWDNIVINLYWIYDERGERGLIWFLKHVQSLEVATKKIEEITILLTVELQKVKKHRNKWVAHRDKEPFEKYDKFWDKESRLTIQDVNRLTETAFEIIQEHSPIVDATNSGIHIPFLLSEVLIKEDFVTKLQYWGFSK